MSARNEILIFERVLAPGIACPDRPVNGEIDAGLDVAVIFTSVDATISALKRASALAGSLSARIILLVPHIVPYPLPLDCPTVPIDFIEKRLRAVASESAVETTVRVYLCRDRLQTLAMVLKPRSLVVLGGCKRWWPTAEECLARRLRRAGHEVVFTATD